MEIEIIIRKRIRITVLRSDTVLIQETQNAGDLMPEYGLSSW
jgi:hypothetical protein